MKAVIDRFEGDYAVLLFGDGDLKAEIPRVLLPEGATEGSWLKVSFELDEEETLRRKEKIGSLLEKLKNKKTKGSR